MGNNNSFTIKKFIRASRDKVFNAWLDPETLKKWDCPEHCEHSHLEQNVIVGGTYRNSMIDNGVTVTVFGTYREVVLNTKLVFTSQWEDSNSPETLVTVEFADKEGGTEVTLSQTGFENVSTTKGHEEGWASCLNRLAYLWPTPSSKSVTL